MSDFTLAPQIQNSSVSVRMIGPFELRLVDDARYLWLLLIPHIADITELHHLPEALRHQLIDNAAIIASCMQSHTKADKMNVAAIGNIVPQMHVHIIARHKDDDAWPDPVWGRGSPTPYEPEKRKATMTALQSWLDGVSDRLMSPDKDYRP